MRHVPLIHRRLRLKLWQFKERNPGMAKGFLRTQKARERCRRQWEELAVRINSIGGTIKNYKQWTKVSIAFFTT